MFSDILKDLRSKKGITQSELAKYLNVTQQAVGRWEKNITSPDYTTLSKIASYFNVSVDYLLGRTDEPQGTGFQKGLLGNAPLGQKAPNAKENPSYGLSIQGDLLTIDEMDVHLHPKLAEKVKKGIELALYDELKEAKKKKGS